MQLKNVSLLLLMTLLSSLLTSCATVPDVPLCKELGPDRGYCAWTLKPKEQNFYVDEDHPYAFDPKKPEEKFTWWEIRPLMIQLPPHSWAMLKAYIIKQCNITKRCRSDIGEWLAEFEKK
jgi:hypothetical protein